MAGTPGDPLQIANMAGLSVAVYQVTLDTTCNIPSKFSKILGVQATYKSGSAAIALVATWSGQTVTITGTTGATDVVNVLVYGLL